MTAAAAVLGGAAFTPAMDSDYRRDGWVSYHRTPLGASEPRRQRADPVKAAARKRQKKARAITRTKSR
ncbi:hypothetical protein ACJ4V0_15965 [Phreatobacter sp. HK31-P]